MYCKKCGKVIDDDSEFCSNCGTAVSIKKSVALTFVVIVILISLIILSIPVIIFNLKANFHYINMPDSFYYGDKNSTNNIGLYNWLKNQYNLIKYDAVFITYCVKDSENKIYYEIIVQKKMIMDGNVRHGNTF